MIDHPFNAKSITNKCQQLLFNLLGEPVECGKPEKDHVQYTELTLVQTDDEGAVELT